MVSRALLAISLTLLAGCASTPAAIPPTGPTAAQATPTVAAGQTATAASSATPQATGAVTSAPTRISNKATVNLVFTGTYAFTAAGTGGTCPDPLSASGQPALFGFQASESDFPGLGQSYSMLQGTPGNSYVDVKWVIAGRTAFALPGPATPGATLGTVTLSADQRSVAIDTDLAEFSATPRHEHVSGTIACPK